MDKKAQYHLKGKEGQPSMENNQLTEGDMTVNTKTSQQHPVYTATTYQAVQR